MNADGSDVARLTDLDGWSSTPAWSPDGRRIAFSWVRDGGPGIYAVNADGSDITRLNDAGGYPAWSPDRRRIALAWGPGGPLGSPDIWVANADGSDNVRLTGDIDWDVAPAWSPDGRTIAFSRGDPASMRWNIHVVEYAESGSTP